MGLKEKINNKMLERAAKKGDKYIIKLVESMKTLEANQKDLCSNQIELNTKLDKLIKELK